MFDEFLEGRIERSGLFCFSLGLWFLFWFLLQNVNLAPKTTLPSARANWHLFRNMAAPATSKKPPLFLFRLYCLLALLLCARATAIGATWQPVSKEELLDSKPQIDADAGAEILVHEMTYDQTSFELAKETHYVKIKIYSQHAIDELKKIDIILGAKDEVRNVAARTTKPDGTTVELNPKTDIFDREAVKARSIRSKMTSFALPGLEPGVVVEYRYTLVVCYPDFITQIYFQGAYPTRQLHCKVYRAASRIAAIFFNCASQPLETDISGFSHFKFSNLPAYKEESFSPPKLNASIGALIYPTAVGEGVTEEYWKMLSRTLHKESEATTWPGRGIKKVVNALISPTDTPEKKLEKLHDYCRSKLINFDHDKIAAKSRKAKKDLPTANEVFNEGAGDPEDINAVFAAMARAAGFETRYAQCADRDVLLFNAVYAASWVVPKRVVGVLVNKQWKYFDPGSKFLLPETLDWRNSDTTALLGDVDGKGELVIIPGSPAEANSRHRKAILRLDDEGTLEGDVVVSYTGLWEAEMKMLFEGETDQRCQDLTKEGEFDQRQAEMTNIKIENADNPVGPLRISYHLRIPGYADITGSRMFIQPAVFQKGSAPLFESGPRTANICFRYRYQSTDEVRIDFPDGYKLEQASAPASFNFGDFGTYENKLTVVSRGRALQLERTRRLLMVAFPKSSYGALVGISQSIQKSDNHTLTLKRREAPPAASSVVAPAAAVPPKNEVEPE